MALMVRLYITYYLIYNANLEILGHIDQPIDGVAASGGKVNGIVSSKGALSNGTSGNNPIKVSGGA